MAEAAGTAGDQQFFVLGTAGHIDHGKTTLVKALTGIDTDTLAEEQRRGITIDLGFAWLDLSVGAEHCSAQPHGESNPAEQCSAPTAIRFGIVDVPGHARFIRNMAAGAAGIDLVLLVVAADDGVMPQTVEHLQICRLLGVRGGVVALTKTDSVDPELPELVAAEVRELLAGTFLEGCPIVPVDSLSGRGLAALRVALAYAAQCLPRRAVATDRFRLAVDRSFSVKGAGTVVTGTVLSGTVSVDSEVELLPAGRRLRVRGLQAHGAEAQSAGAGQRIALNLAGVDRQVIQRGDVLAAPGWLHPSPLLDARLELLRGEGRPLRSGSAAQLHLHASEQLVKLALLDARALPLGGSGLVQLRLAAPLACVAGDRFILRSSDGQRTLGGGVVLDPRPSRHQRRRIDAAAQLDALDPADPAAQLLHETGRLPYGVSAAAAAQLLGWDEAQLAAAITLAQPAGLLVHAAGRSTFLTAPLNRERISSAALERLERYHAEHPLARRGLSVAELASGLSARGLAVPLAAVAAALAASVESGQLAMLDETYTLRGRAVVLSAKDQQAMNAILAAIRGSLSPAQPAALLDGLPVDKPRLGQLIAMLLEDGELLAAPGPVYFDPAVVEQARLAATAALRRPGADGITVSGFNALLGTTRKYGLPLLQLFENEGLLRRDGDLRRLK